MSEQLRLDLDRMEAERENIFPATPEGAFSKLYRCLRLQPPAPEFQVEFRPFAGLRSTIRIRGGRAEVRVSDMLKSAPGIVFEALAEILLGQAFRRRPSREARECFMAYVTGPPMARQIDRVRRERGSKRLLPPRGRRHDLETVFDGLNRRFFNGELPWPRLGWSPRRSRTLLGNYDAAHNTITISRWLDSPKFPRYLLDYLMYHEMLHIKFPTERRGARRVVHSAHFRAAEKQFPLYAAARRRLKHICGE